MQTVWVVDDSPLAATIACEALAPEFVCDVFPTGLPVLERLAQGQIPDVLLLDLELPDVSGIELCRMIRNTHDDLVLPILFVTGQRDSVVAALAVGANDHVAKPYVPSELMARTRSLARTRNLWRRSAALESQLAMTLRSIGDGVISTDQHARVVFTNAVAEQLTGWTNAEAVGQRLADVFHIVHGTTRAIVPSSVDEVLRTGVAAVLANNIALLRRDGTEIPVDVRAAPIRDALGMVSGAVLVFRDITGRRAADLERERLLAEARLRGDFERQLIGIVSHDLRSPLTTIALSAEVLLRNDQLRHGSLKTLLRLKRAADQGTRLVSDLLDFTKVRLGGGITIQRAPCNLHTIVRQVVEDMRTTSPDREIRVTTSGDGHGEWDHDRMCQVVTNLVTNALKYGPTSVIEVESESTIDGITVSVHNMGAPIDEAAQERIFQPLQRATSQLENTARSVGLGLFIVKHLVEAHGGWVSVTSTQDAGTTFVLWVPKTRAELPRRSTDASA